MSRPLSPGECKLLHSLGLMKPGGVSEEERRDKSVRRGIDRRPWWVRRKVVDHMWESGSSFDDVVRAFEEAGCGGEG